QAHTPACAPLSSTVRRQTWVTLVAIARSSWLICQPIATACSRQAVVHLALAMRWSSIRDSPPRTDYLWCSCTSQRLAQQVTTKLKYMNQNSVRTLGSMQKLRQLGSPQVCRLTPRWSGRVRDKVPSSYNSGRAAQLNR